MNLNGPRSYGSVKESSFAKCLLYKNNGLRFPFFRKLLKIVFDLESLRCSWLSFSCTKSMLFVNKKEWSGHLNHLESYCSLKSCSSAAGFKTSWTYWLKNGNCKIISLCCITFQLSTKLSIISLTRSWDKAITRNRFSNLILFNE